MSPIPNTQKVWTVIRRGSPSQALFLDTNARVPSKLAPGEVLVRVEAAALNPVGYRMMATVPNFIAKRPHVAEHDLSGVVVDANGTALHDGQAVYGAIFVASQFKSHQGALAQYTRLPASDLVPRPPGLSPTAAAGLSLVGLTAYQALFRTGALEPGQHLFVNGGSTAVGIAAIQLAKAVGCTVTASASGKREPLLRSLGVDHFLDYTKAPVHEQLERDPSNTTYHVLLDAVGVADFELYTHSAGYLAPGGTFVSVGMWPKHGFGRLLRYGWEIFRPRFIGGTDRLWKLIVVSMDPEDFKNFAQYVEDGKVKPVIDSVYSFEDAPKAYERMMSSRAAGKVVIKIDSSVD